MSKTKYKQKMSEILRIPIERIEDEALLSELVCDSFALIDMVIELQDEFEVFLVQDDLKDVKTVAQLIGVLESHRTSSSVL